MFKKISRNIFLIVALGFSLSAIDLSAQTREGRADEPSVGGSERKAGKRIIKSTFFPEKLLSF